MSYRIAIAGKGGVGKTTVAGLVVWRLIHRGCRPVLAVDADPNTCLDAALGVTAEKTVGRVREEAKAIAGKGLLGGVAKQELLELKIAESLVEEDDFDLVAMGRSEGAGCYCYANNVLKQTIASLSGQYPYVVLDNEAGLENLSRRIAPQVNLLLMVSDPSRRGLDTIGRLHQLAREMGIVYERLGLVVNRLRGAEPPARLAELQASTGADFTFTLSDDPHVADCAERGLSLSELPADASSVASVDSMLDQVGLHPNKGTADDVQQ